jgi:hypothetical protein
MSSSNPFFRRSCNHKLLNSACHNCGSVFLYCPICHPEMASSICNLCERPRVEVPSHLEQFYKSALRSEQASDRKEKSKQKKKEYQRNYDKLHAEENRQKSRERYHADLEASREAHREYMRLLRYRQKEEGIPGYPEQHARELATRKAWREANPDKVRGQWQRKYETHRDQINQRRRERYHARKSHRVPVGEAGRTAKTCTVPED